MEKQQDNIIKQYEALVETMKDLAISIIQKDNATNADLAEASCILKQAASYQLHLKTLYAYNSN